MSLEDPKVNDGLSEERTKDVGSDPRLAAYILGQDAAYNWQQRLG